MHQIYITALITTLIAVAFIGGLIKWRSDKLDFRFLLILFLIELPMAILTFYLVRIYLLDYAVKYLIGGHINMYGIAKTFYAPLTEEPAKLLPLLIPALRNRITKENFVWVALALGLGFGIGEIWLVGYFIATTPVYANIPWYQFTGFINERFMVCLIHGGFTAFALWKLCNKSLWGIAVAMLVHFLGNFPIYLAHLNIPAFGKGAWQTILGLWTVFFFIAIVGFLSYLKLGKIDIISLVKGKSVCPECNAVYSGSIFGLNWFTARYEKCSECKKWHWVRKWVKDEPKKE
jgi:hypothetical protein